MAVSRKSQREENVNRGKSQNKTQRQPGKLGFDELQAEESRSNAVEKII